MARKASREDEDEEDEPKRALSTKHRATLAAIFESPTRSNIAWLSVEALFVALGASVIEGRGSRVRVYLNDRVAIFHRPHPRKETHKGAVESVRDFLTSAGVEP